MGSIKNAWIASMEPTEELPVTDAELVNHLRLLSGYHLGTDLVDRLAHAERTQNCQREALKQAADRIEQLQAELAKATAET